MKKSIFALSALTLILVGCDNQQDAKVEEKKSLMLRQHLLSNLRLNHQQQALMQRTMLKTA